MNYLDRRKARPITDALRATVLEDLPELAGVKDEELRRKAIEAWAYSLSETSFPRVSAIPGRGDARRLCAQARQPGAPFAQRGADRGQYRG